MLNVVLNVLVTPLFCRRFSSTCLAGMNSALVVPTSRVPRCSDHRSASMTLPLEPRKRPTAPIPSTFIALVSLREPRDLMLHLYPPSSRSSFHPWWRSHQPHLLVLIFAGSLLYKESKVDNKLWHIARLLYNSFKACWAIHAVTKKKCTTKVVTNYKSTPAPTYLGV